MVEDGEEQDDASLVLAAQAGDQEAFAHLFRRHYPTVRRVCARRLASGGDADEVTQAAFVRAYERIHQCCGERRFGAWVQVIALRLCGEAWRARARTTPMADPVPAPAGPDSCMEALLRKEREAAVRCALATLPPRQREVIVARYVEGRRPRDVAAALAVSVGAVDSLLLRARRRLVLACQASGVEHGAVSASVATGSLAAGSTAVQLRTLLGPLGRLAESFSGMVDVVGAGVAGALGLGPIAPAAIQRAAGLVGAGALLFAPLASDTGRPEPVTLAVPGPKAVPVPVGADHVVGAPGFPEALAAVLPPVAGAQLTVPRLSAPAVPEVALPAFASLDAHAASIAGRTAPAAAVSATVDPGTLTAPAAALGHVAETVTAGVGHVSSTVTPTLGQVAVAVAATSTLDQIAVAGLVDALPPALP